MPLKPGIVSTPAPSASFLLSILSPIARIANAFGPTNAAPAASTASENSAFSERKP